MKGCAAMFLTRHRITGGLIGLGTVGALLATTVPAQAADVEFAARLQPTTSYHQARGHADYEADHDGREFEIQLAGVRSLHGQRLTVRVHGAFVGSMVVNRYGRAHLERHTAVRVRAGNVVRVRTHSGTLVSYGKFYRHYD